MTSRTEEAARGKWRGILEHFGMDPRFLEDKHGPCPICPDGGGKDRFRWDNSDGNGGYYCSACDPGTGMHLLMSLKGWYFGRAASEVDKILGVVQVAEVKKERSEESKRAYMKRLFRESRPVVAGDPVHLYLTRRCGDTAGLLGDIRFHPAIKHSLEGGTHPAMLAFMGWNPATKKFSGIHWTYLTRDGRKASVDPVRQFYGGVGPVRLGPIQERMGLAEGIETALSAGQLFGLPVWAATCADAMKKWEPPPEVRSVVLFGDNDVSFTGQAAAYEKGRALRAKGLDVEIHIPLVEGTDWNDVWAEAQMQRVA